MLRELTLQDLYEKFLVMIQCCTIVCYEPETLKASHNKENLHFFHKQKHVTPVILKKNSYHDISLDSYVVH